ncbi:ankyrin repeat domain-containing protein [Parashewanella curva]|uniref:Ankyrin repeat domain-containing protein n=1 Tax=Parashewanella curva TaxID=2338552 RepID=A0A3L8PUS5_9GAMM|nr:ankyrin repeat domain-containing protein [Parashewanella curva]
MLSTNGVSGLHFAVMQNKVDIVKRLLKANADITVKSSLSAGKTSQIPFELAKNKGNGQIIELLKASESKVK